MDVDFTLKDDLPPSAWIVELGGYGVLEPTYLGSKYYNVGFKPLIGFRQAGDREWLSFPNDAFDYNLYETANFRAGPAGNLTLQSRLHGQDIDLRLGKADVDLQGGAFAEYYPVNSIRTRAELSKASRAIWDLPSTFPPITSGARPPTGRSPSARAHRLLTISTLRTIFRLRSLSGTIILCAVPRRKGRFDVRSEFTGQYAWTAQITTKFYIDYNQLMGDAADSPRVSLKGSSEQVILGVGATYKFAVQP